MHQQAVFSWALHVQIIIMNTIKAWLIIQFDIMQWSHFSQNIRKLFAHT